MIKNKSILALILARQGSKGLPGKNIKLLHGKPLIGWSIEAARLSKYIDRIVVTSDSEKILLVARQFGAETPFRRPKNISGDHSKLEDAILHAMDWIERHENRKYDFIMCLTPTHPLRTAILIDKVTEYFINHQKAKAVITVVECSQSPLQASKLPKDLLMKNFIPRKLRLKNRQELPVFYQLSGSVSISEWQYFKKVGTFIGPRTYAYITGAKEGLDIDSSVDFLLAETYFLNPKIL